MNEIMALLTTYGISLNQALAIGGIGMVVLLIGAKIALKKKPSTDKTSQAVTPFSIAPNTYNSLQTDEVNSFLIPREDIDNFKSYTTSPEQNLLTPLSSDEEREIQEKIARIPRVSTPLFLDEIVNPAQSVLEDKPVIKKEPTEKKEEIKEKEPTEEIVEQTLPSRESYTASVKTLIDESLHPQTIPYHRLIEDALYFDSLDDKNKAIEKLEEACALVDSVRINFYLKICIQNYKNQENTLSKIMEQFFMTQKEKLEKETKKSNVMPGSSFNLTKPIANEALDVKQSSEFMMPMPRRATPWPEGSVLVSEGNELKPYKSDGSNKSNNSENSLENHALSSIELSQSLPTTDITDMSAQEPKKEIEASEFSDDVTKEQFMQAFGSMFTLKDTPATGPQDVPENAPTYGVWVNWVAIEDGKVNFKNDPFELKGPWGTKVAIEDLQAQIKSRIKENSQFSVLSAFEVK